MGSWKPILGNSLTQERSAGVPAEVLELPQKGDRIIHFAWEPHVSSTPALCLYVDEISILEASLILCLSLILHTHFDCGWLEL